MPKSHFPIVSEDVLKRMAGDPKLSRRASEQAAYTLRLTQYLNGIRKQHASLAGFVLHQERVKLTDNPVVMLFDCQQTESMPGLPVMDPGNSKDASVQRVYRETVLMLSFLRQVFKRNSIDNAGMTVMSSVHFGNGFHNAMWSGMRMIYGDGDGELFIDFTSSMDVIGHELTHGIMQYTLQLGYDGEPGGLNESVADCFGTMFRQWRLKQDAASADWLLGSDILGPLPRERGYTCMRDMAVPDGKHCLAPQPTHYRQLKSVQHPHGTSGPPNHAFCTACKLVGGNSWETIGQIWYQAVITAGLAPNMTMAQFADKTREQACALYGRGSPAETAVGTGWKKVGL